MRNEHSAAEKIKEIQWSKSAEMYEMRKMFCYLPVLSMKWISSHISLYPMLQNEDIEALDAIRNLCGNAFPASPAWSVAQEM